MNDNKTIFLYLLFGIGVFLYTNSRPINFLQKRKKVVEDACARINRVIYYDDTNNGVAICKYYSNDVGFTEKLMNY